MKILELFTSKVFTQLLKICVKHYFSHFLRRFLSILLFWAITLLTCKNIDFRDFICPLNEINKKKTGKDVSHIFTIYNDFKTAK